MRFFSPFVVLALFAASTVAAHGDTIYSDLGPGQTYDNSSGGYDIGTFLTSNQVIAVPFVPNETVRLSGASLALQQIFGENPMTVYIASSSSGAPGPILDTLSQVGTIEPFPPSMVDFTCSTCSVLNVGDTYFLVAQQSDPDSLSEWQLALNHTGTIYDNVHGTSTGPWTTDPNLAFAAFEVNGTPFLAPAATPEPASLLLFGSGIMGVAGLARRKFLPHP
jgi:hypothetical protein